MARLVAEAIETAVPIRRCTARPSATPRPAPCTPAQLGVATCPCAGLVSRDEYERLVRQVVTGLTVSPRLLLDPLATRMHELAAAERYEEAASVRDRAAALATAVDRRRRLDTLRRSGHVVLAGPDGTEVELLDGRLLGVRRADAADTSQPMLALDLDSSAHLPAPAREHVDELLAVDRWLQQHASGLVVRSGSLPLLTELEAEPLPNFRPASPLVSGARQR